jgi:hypothetical protein
MERITFLVALLGFSLLCAFPEQGSASPDSAAIAAEQHRVSFPPGVEACLLSALLYGGRNPAELGYQAIRIQPQSCPFTAYLQGNSLILIMADLNLKVEIPVPDQVGWQRFHYIWGSHFASIEGKEMPVRLISLEKH